MTKSTISAREALDRLREGNRRFVAETRSRQTVTSQARRLELAPGQEPFASILGCSDSRVPAEIVFEQGLGDLFVIRVAGNIVAPSQVGSVEFAAPSTRWRRESWISSTGCRTLVEPGRPDSPGGPGDDDATNLEEHSRQHQAVARSVGSHESTVGQCAKSISEAHGVMPEAMAV